MAASIPDGNVSLHFPIERLSLEKNTEDKLPQRSMQLIAQGASLDEITSHLDKKFWKCGWKCGREYMTISIKNDLRGKGEYGLTHAILSIMMHRHDVLEHILRHKVNLSVKDTCGLTAMHWACALQDTKSMNLLQEAQKIDRISLDVFDHVPAWKDILAPQFPAPTDVVCMMTDGTEVTAEKFQEITGARFYAGITAEPQEWVNSLTKQFSDTSNVRTYFNRWISENYDPNNFPSLVLGKQGVAGYGVFAGERLHAGQIAGIYGGELKEVVEYSNYDFMGILDGAKIRNLTAMINDGFPNCVLSSAYLPDGQTVAVLLVIRDIEPGEALSIDYGPAHSAKLGAHSEFQLQKMETYFKQADLKALLKARAVSPNSFKQWAANYEKIAARYYLSNTPSALLILCLNGIIPLSFASQILNEQIGMGSYGPEFFKMALDIEAALNALKISVSKVPPHKRPDFKEAVGEWLQKYPYKHVIRFIDTAYFLHKLIDEKPFREEAEDILNRYVKAKEIFESLKTTDDYQAFHDLIEQLPEELQKGFRIHPL